MLKIWHKVQMYFFKRKQLTNVLMERIFIIQNYKEFLEDDENKYHIMADKLRDEMRKKMEAKEPLGENDNKDIMDLDEKSKKIVAYKNILNSSYISEKEIKDFIEIIKQNFWK